MPPLLQLELWDTVILLEIVALTPPNHTDASEHLMLLTASRRLSIIAIDQPGADIDPRCHHDVSGGPEIRLRQLASFQTKDITTAASIPTSLRRHWPFTCYSTTTTLESGASSSASSTSNGVPSHIDSRRDAQSWSLVVAWLPHALKQQQKPIHVVPFRWQSDSSIDGPLAAHPDDRSMIVTPAADTPVSVSSRSNYKLVACKPLTSTLDDDADAAAVVVVAMAFAVAVPQASLLVIKRHRTPHQEHRSSDRYTTSATVLKVENEREHDTRISVLVPPQPTATATLLLDEHDTLFVEACRPVRGSIGTWVVASTDAVDLYMLQCVASRSVLIATRLHSWTFDALYAPTLSLHRVDRALNQLYLSSHGHEHGSSGGLVRLSLRRDDALDFALSLSQEQHERTPESFIERIELPSVAHELLAARSCTASRFDQRMHTYLVYRSANDTLLVERRGTTTTTTELVFPHWGPVTCSTVLGEFARVPPAVRTNENDDHESDDDLTVLVGSHDSSQQSNSWRLLSKVPELHVISALEQDLSSVNGLWSLKHEESYYDHSGALISFINESRVLGVLGATLDDITYACLLAGWLAG